MNIDKFIKETKCNWGNDSLLTSAEFDELTSTVKTLRAQNAELARHKQTYIDLLNDVGKILNIEDRDGDVLIARISGIKAQNAELLKQIEDITDDRNICEAALEGRGEYIAELLEALERIAWHKSDASTWDMDVCEVARAAIAKAKGN